MKEYKDKFMTQAKFSAAVEEVVKNSNGLVNYIDAVIVVCDDLDIEVDRINCAVEIDLNIEFDDIKDHI